MTKFIIADDHPLFREALVGALEKKFNNIHIAESASLEQTLTLLEADDEQDLVLLDLHMPGSGDFYGLIRIRDTYPQLPIAVISGSDDADIVSKVMGYGAMGFISKASSSTEIAQAIEIILEGDSFIPPHLVGRLTHLSNEEEALASKISELTPQQYKVLTFVHLGYLNKQIAFELGISEATVKAHMTAIFRKLEVSNRTQAVLIAEKLHLEPPA